MTAAPVCPQCGGELYVLTAALLLCVECDSEWVLSHGVPVPHHTED